MLVPLETEPMPEAYNERQAEALVDRMFEDGLPGFVIRSVWEANDEVAEALRPVFSSHEFAVTHKPESRGTLPHPKWHNILPRRLQPTINLRRPKMRYGTAPDYGALHTDTAPSDIPVEWIIIDTVEVGRINIGLLEPADGAIEWYTKRPLIKRTFVDCDRDTLLLPRKVYQQIWEGAVDDEFVIPVRHTAELDEGSTVIFRAGGQRPVFHQVTTLEVPRLSRIRSAYKVKSPAPTASKTNSAML